MPFDTAAAARLSSDSMRQIADAKSSGLSGSTSSPASPSTSGKSATIGGNYRHADESSLREPGCRIPPRTRAARAVARLRTAPAASPDRRSRYVARVRRAAPVPDDRARAAIRRRALSGEHQLRNRVCPPACEPSAAPTRRAARRHSFVARACRRRGHTHRLGATVRGVQLARRGRRPRSSSAGTSSCRSTSRR